MAASFILQDIFIDPFASLAAGKDKRAFGCNGFINFVWTILVNNGF
jgi:hypothetical protein